MRGGVFLTVLFSYHSGYKNKALFTQGVVGLFVLPDAAEPVAQKGEHDCATCKNSCDDNCHSAPKAVVYLVAFDRQSDLFCPVAREKLLAKMMSQKRNNGACKQSYC